MMRVRQEERETERKIVTERLRGARKAGKEGSGERKHDCDGVKDG
jgi:hypothetical protein